LKVPWNGLLLVDKPGGPTSHDLVDLVRRVVGQRRVGHAGTLDPLASGLLPLVLGQATRLVRFLPHDPKCYEGRFRLGLRTTSDDVTGQPLSTHAGPLPAAAVVQRAAGALVGSGLQVPPAVSARKVAGRRLYRLAREGVPVVAEPRPVRVDRFDVEPAADAPAEYRFVAEVSSGTYIRGLVRDLGEDLGCGGALVELRRTAIGPMRPSPDLRLRIDAPPELQALRRCLVPLNSMPLELPTLVVGADEGVQRFLAGALQTMPRPEPAGGNCRVVDGRGTLLGVGEVRDSRLRPRVVLQPRGC
jgi:tRNA pseudouridine55 synthase